MPYDAKQPIRHKTLENWLWEAACSIRGEVDALIFTQPLQTNFQHAQLYALISCQEFHIRSKPLVYISRQKHFKGGAYLSLEHLLFMPIGYLYIRPILRRDEESYIPSNLLYSFCSLRKLKLY